MSGRARRDCCYIANVFICPPPALVPFPRSLVSSHTRHYLSPSLTQTLCFEKGSTIVTMLGVKKYYSLRGDSLSYAISFIAGLDFL